MKGLTCNHVANVCWKTGCKDVGLFVELGQSVAVGVEMWYKAGRLSEKGALRGRMRMPVPSTYEELQAQRGVRYLATREPNLVLLKKGI